MYEKLPDDLKRNARFCLWRYETRKGKPTKIPYRTDGRRTGITKASDFSPFDVVTAALMKGGYDGIGIMVGSGFSAVDIDNCVTDGKLSETARDIVDTMDSYTETSPSGTGIRIIFDAENRDRGLHHRMHSSTMSAGNMTNCSRTRSKLVFRQECGEFLQFQRQSHQHSQFSQYGKLICRSEENNCAAMQQGDAESPCKRRGVARRRSA